jgi:hypothetical protein
MPLTMAQALPLNGTGLRMPSSDTTGAAIRSALLAYWPLSEASGQPRLDRAGGSNLLDNNGVGTAAGKVGSTAAQFVAAGNDFLSCPFTWETSPGDSAYSLFAWVYLDSKADYRMILTRGDGNAEYQLYYDVAADDFDFLIGNGATQRGQVHSTNAGHPATATWYFLVAWYDGAILNISVNNGTANSSARTGAPAAVGDSVRIGRRADGYPFDGRIGPVGIVGRVLTAAERSYLYNNGAGRALVPAQSRRVAFYNGATAPGAAHSIGRALTIPGSTTRFRNVGPALVAVGAGGTWDQTSVSQPWVLYDGGTYKLWYGGSNGSNWKIGHATSSDGVSWAKSGSNPVLSVGAGGQFDETGLLFPVVYKDAEASASKRYKMLYGGLNASGKIKVGYAYSADGVSWTKGAANPVLSPGAGGSWDDEGVIPTALVKSGSTYYLFYDGRGATSYPLDDQVGLATFTDFEGAYSKDPGNPILARRTGDQALAANVAAGATSVQVGSSAGFIAGETVMLVDEVNTHYQQVAISAIPDGTHLTLARPALFTFNTADGCHVVTQARAVYPRSVLLESGLWRMWLAAFQSGITNDRAESSSYATSSSPNSGWALSHTADSPPLPLFGLGLAGSWAARSNENLCVVVDADTGLPITVSA